jgi:hypothetical protein
VGKTRRTTDRAIAPKLAGNARPRPIPPRLRRSSGRHAENLAPSRHAHRPYCYPKNANFEPGRNLGMVQEEVTVQVARVDARGVWCRLSLRESTPCRGAKGDFRQHAGIDLPPTVLVDVGQSHCSIFVCFVCFVVPNLPRSSYQPCSVRSKNLATLSSAASPVISEHSSIATMVYVFPATCSPIGSFVAFSVFPPHPSPFGLPLVAPSGLCSDVRIRNRTISSTIAPWRASLACVLLRSRPFVR